MPPRDVEYGGVTFAELGVAAVRATPPDFVLADELAHTHPDGSRRRWEDDAELLGAGISVLATLNVANLLTSGAAVRAHVSGWPGGARAGPPAEAQLPLAPTKAGATGVVVRAGSAWMTASP